MIKDINDITEFQQIEQQKDTFTLLKHSLTCPISAAANQAFENYSKNSDKQLYRLKVQTSRELSNYVAKKYDIKHESPQVLKIESNKVTWDASHYDITEDSLHDNL
ncbi:bacillithiol system protein YtxJ [Gracilibacillus ureilyticus]|uniref:Bacillithiol system protein YtxJ n=1 Tax=Gracilibacillus ureilyticus TaxID=531814 RepID=A0A1H9TDE9_9BACI|nr:bacillithiol system redox-active protein YtxJ [Gracilibacillus ureilyticus]SER94984.1 bacillithiol system protein YtxJ [Gracilibacillus ureilyticus]